VKKRLTIGIVAAALAAPLSFVAAGSSGREPVTDQAPPPGARGLTIVRAYAPNDQRGPRIIHVPQAGERDQRTNDRAGIDDRDRPAISNDVDDDEVVPAPRRRLLPAPRRPIETQPRPRTPRWQVRSEAPPPPPPEPRRAVLSVPPPPAEGPTPIRPTPRFSAKADPADKFSQPRDASASEPPPAGYTPPTALPQED
jgi:hypothetical protein